MAIRLISIKEIEEDWVQNRIVHCPAKNCRGMLLQNDFKHEELCSDCDTLYIEHENKWEIVKENYLTNN